VIESTEEICMASVYEAKPEPSMLKITGIVLAVLAAIAIFIGGYIFVAILIPRPADGIPVTIGGLAGEQMKIQELSRYKPPLRYFDTTDESVKYEALHSGGEIVLRSDELFRFEDDDAITSFYIIENLDGKNILEAFCMNKKDNQVSNVLMYFANWMDPTEPLFPTNYVYSDADAAAQYIFDTLRSFDVYSRANSDQFTAIGVSESDSVYDMTILGKPPTDIYTFTFEGTKYYVWCYVGLDMRKALIGDPNDHSKYTLGKMEELLDIRFD
jgi:hypothetical protein